MLDAKTIQYYKELYSGHKLIYVRFSDKEFLFRTLTRKEYRMIRLASADKHDLEDIICTSACVHPDDKDFSTCEYAGLVPFCSKIIETQSGFTDISIVLKEYHKVKEQETMETQCMDLIKAFIPEYTYEQMEDWTWDHLMNVTVRAEKVAKMRGYEWGLKDISEEVNEKFNNIDINNDSFTKELIESGIDPMLYFHDSLKDKFKKDIINFPMIMGNHWQDDEVVKIVRDQIHKQKTKPDG